MMGEKGKGRKGEQSWVIKAFMPNLAPLTQPSPPEAGGEGIGKVAGCG